MQISYSTELMKNYKQADLFSPDKKFKALQADNGDALLFSIGTDGVFYMIEQTSGSNATGWNAVDLSSALLCKNLAACAVKDFAVGQDPVTKSIDLALVISSGGKDNLYLAQEMGNIKGAITSGIVWSAVPFDDPAHAGVNLDIADVFISQRSGSDYIVVDVSESSFTPPADFLKRYYIDASKKRTGRVWNPMVIGGDLDPGVQTRLGRKSGDRVDATYTLGIIGGVNELLYAPLYNPFDLKAPPTITRLAMPAGASSIALASSGNGANTDLFVTAADSLYYFAADKQQDNAAGQKVFTSAFLRDVVELHAYRSSDRYVVWGLNRANQVFYTECDVDKVAVGPWSLPLPIITGVDKISAYVNGEDDSNIIFSAGNNSVHISVRSPETSLWNSHSVQLTAPPQTAATAFSSYTTRIQLEDGANTPLANTEVLLSASSPVPVYINHLYYQLDTTPIPVTSDALGSLTVVEAVGGLDSIRLTVAQESGTAVTINPMEKPFKKSISLDSKEKLRGAVITSPDGKTRPLISASVSDKDLSYAGQMNAKLAKAYTKNSSMAVAGTRVARLAATRVSVPAALANGIEADIGNLFKWLESGIEHELQIIENEAAGLWYFVITIGEEIYHGILDTVEAVVGAVRWVYNAIKVAVEDLLKFLEFLFEWNDITRTKDVLKNVMMQFMRYETDQIEVVKEKLNDEIKGLVNTINGWAGIKDWNGLGAAATAPVKSSSTPNKNSSAPANLVSYHFNNNVANTKQLSPVNPLNPSKNPIDTLMNALKQEGVVIDAVFEQLKQLGEDYDKLDLATVLTRVVVIIADGVLESAEVVVDAMLDILYELVSGILDALDTPIYIPVVSDILKEFGVPSLSFMDLFCWIAAIPVTLAYKIATGKAPFQNDATTTFLKSSDSWESIALAFSGAQAGLGAGAMELDRSSASELVTAPARSVSLLNLPTIPDSAKQAIFVTGHAASGFFTLMSCFVSTFEAEAETGENPFAIPSAILGVLSAVTAGAASVLVPKDPIKNSIVSWVSTATTAAVLLTKLLFSGPAQTKFGASTGVLKVLKAADGRATGAIINSILVLPALACTCWHFYELSQDKADATRSAAIIDETANLTSYISRVSYAVAVNDPDPESKQIPIAIMAVANVVTGGLQTAEAVVGA